MNTTFIKIIILIITLSVSINAYSSPHCGDLHHTYGPYDYNLHKGMHRSPLKVVEANHFTKNIETLASGNTSSLGGELTFVLLTFPNHHRALLTLSNLAIRDKTHKPRGAKYSVLCYFDRAIRFKPEDATVYSIFSAYLLKTGKNKLALQNLEIAEKLEPKNPTIKYNMGLIYFKKKEYDKAMFYAKEAYALGFPLPGLKNQLKKVGKWTQ